MSKKSILIIVKSIIGFVFAFYLYTEIRKFSVQTNSNTILTGMYFVEFGIHELGHIVTFFLPQIFSAMAGSFFEILFTITLLVESLRKKSYVAAAFCAQWVMLSLTSVGNYISDARSQSLPLAGVSANPIHDWNYILTEFGQLQNDVFIGNITKGIGGLVGSFGLFILLYSIVAFYQKVK